MLGLYTLKTSKFFLNFNKNLLLKNFAVGKNKSLKNNKDLAIEQTQEKEKVLFDPSNQEFSKLRSNLMYSLAAKDKNIKLRPDYESIFKSTIEVINYYSKTKEQGACDLINSTLLIFLEKHISMFTWEQMIRLSAEMARNNLGTVVVFNAISDSLYKKLQMEKQKMMRGVKQENLKLTQMLYYYFSVMAEVSMMEVGVFNYILEYFGNHSASLIKEDIKEVDLTGLNNVYDFVWLTSLSIASIFEKRKTFKQVEEYVDTISPVLNEKGARALMKILTHLDATIHLDKNFSENTSNKVRLFKSLYYLKLEGIAMPKNLEKFLKEFQPFLLMNNEKSTTSSTLELKFEKILKDLDIPYEKEKKLPFCTVDFFVKPHIVLEVNGPSHYVFNSEYPIAKDLLKKRVLSMETYDYNSISYTSIHKNEKSLISALEQRFKHVKEGLLQDLEKTLEEEKSVFYLNQKEKSNRGEQVEERINNAKYLV